METNKKSVEKAQKNAESKELTLEVRRVRTNVRAGMAAGHSRSVA